MKNISDKLNAILLDMANGELNKVKLSFIINLINLGSIGVVQLSPFELFTIGKELGTLQVWQSERSNYDITELEIAETISRIESFLKNL